MNSTQLVALIIGLLLAGGTLAAPDHSANQKASERQGNKDTAAWRTEMRARHTELSSRLPDAARNNPARLEISDEEWRSVKAQNTTPRGRYAVGLTKILHRPIRFANGQSSEGATQAMVSGGQIWSVALEARGATALRVHFRQLSLPPGTSLYVFNDEGDAFAMPAGNDLWSNTVLGSKVYVQLHRGATAASPSVTIEALGAMGEDYVNPNAVEHAFQSNNAACVENASCYDTGDWAEIDSTRDAVAQLNWPAGPYLYICTGGLLADTDPNSSIPYLLTANHCLSRNKDARNLEAQFQFITPCNGPELDFRNHTGPRTLGARVMASNRSSDYTLLKLSQSPPAGSVYLGWNTAAVHADHGDLLYRISHPDGSPQAYSQHVIDTGAGTCSGWPRGDWIYSRDVLGATEGGSSGSPVLNASGQVVGQLSGACGFNVNDVCDRDANATVDGAFAAYYEQVAEFLDPAPTTPEICDNGVDDDGDADIDCADSDCADDPVCGGGSCQLAQKGDNCLVNSDCCSNKCKGRSGNKTCK